MTTFKLNPCGCGGSARLIWTPCGDDDLERLHLVQCKKCGMETDDYMTEDKAAAAWNLAHPLAIRLEDVREMVEIIKECRFNDGNCEDCEKVNECYQFKKCFGPMTPAYLDDTLLDIAALTAYVTGKGGVEA